MFLGAVDVECVEAEFSCGSGGLCLPLSLVCNGKNDCGDWQDEPHTQCGVNECDTHNGGCDQVSQVVDKGPVVSLCLL